MPYSQSDLSLQYVGVPIISPTLDGQPLDPTSMTVEMAFTDGSDPQTSDWQPAEWQATDTYPHTAACLVGPGGTVQLAAGSYVVWVKINASPESPVLVSPGRLQIT